MKQHPDSHRFSPLSTSRPPFSRFAPCPPLSHSLNAANKNNTALSATREHHRREAEGSWIHVNYKNNSAKRSNNRPLHSQCLARRVVSREKSPHSRPVTILPLLSLLFLSSFLLPFHACLSSYCISGPGENCWKNCWTENKNDLANSEKDGSVFLEWLMVYL